MACEHHFGIIDKFDELKDYGALEEEYPCIIKKHNCISYDDDALTRWALDLTNTEMHWHRYGNYGKGLAWCGITLIPPYILPEIIHWLALYIKKSLFCDAEALKLLGLLKNAFKESKWVIHCGC